MTSPEPIAGGIEACNPPGGKGLLVLAGEVGAVRVAIAAGMSP